MAKFHSLMLSPNMSTTTEGYLIAHNVPICRSGYQDYYGNELKDFPGYKDSWGLKPDTKYTVFRPPHEVLHRDTIRSFEGKTICDEHPSGDVVTVDNEKEVNRGHIQNVKQGPDHDGQVTLQGDFVIKDTDLIDKVRPKGDPESGIRDVSCGYTLKLRRRNDGTIEMYDIRGNHVAVVEKGRAGPRIAIKDSTPPEIKPRKDNTMSIRDMIFGRGLKAYAEDASPEDLAKVVQDGSVFGLTRPALDSADPKLTKTETTPIIKSPYHDDPHIAAAHAALDRALEAAKSPSGMGIDAFGKQKGLKGLKAEVDSFISQEEDEPEHTAKDGIATLKKAGGKQVQPGETASDDDDDDDDDRHANDDDDDDDRSAKDAFGKKGHVAEDDDDDDDDDAANDDASEGEIKGERKRLHEGAADEGMASGCKIDDKGKNVLKQLNDSVRSYIKVSRPMVASIVAKPKKNRTRQEQMMVDTYNRAVKSINRANGNAYSVLTKTKIPEGIPALATDSSREANVIELETISRFYEGVPYRIGKAKHDAYLAQKGSK